MRSGIGNSASDPLFVASSGAGPTTGATSTSVTPASDATSNPFPVVGNVASGAADTGSPVKVGGRYNLAAPTFTDGQRGDLQLDSSGVLKVKLTGGGIVASIAALQGDGGGAPAGVLATASYPYVFNGTTYYRATQPNAVSLIPSSAATTNATSAKGAAGIIHNVTAYNATAAVKFLKIYNKASAPTVGTDTPIMTFAIPPNGTLSHSFQNGGFFLAAGIAYALTGLAANSDTTALAAGDVVGLNIAYS